MINLNKKDPIADAVKEILQQEALKGNQHKIDANKNGKVDAHDFKILRGEKKTVKEEETVDEGIKDVAKKAFKALTGGSDEDQRKDLQRKMGVPQTGKKPTQKEEVEGKTLKQFRENAFDWKKKPEPTPNGGSGVKQGSRYGGSKQKDKPEQDTDEKK